MAGNTPDDMDGAAVSVPLEHQHAGTFGIVRIILHYNRLIHPQQDLPDEEPVGGYFIIAVCRDSDLATGDQIPNPL